jgi:hypothetical protein
LGSWNLEKKLVLIRGEQSQGTETQRKTYIIGNNELIEESSGKFLEPGEKIFIIESLELRVKSFYWK